MKLLQVNKFYWPHIGGIEKVVAQIKEALGGEVLCCTDNSEVAAKAAEQVTKTKTIFTAFGMPISLKFFSYYKQTGRLFETIILHHPFPAAFLAELLFPCHRQLVVWYHSDIVRQKITGWIIRPLIKKILSRADKILVANENIISSSSILKEFKNKITVVPFGVENPKPTDNMTVANIKKEFGNPLILAVGRLIYYKGFEYFIESMQQVKAHGLIIGEGPLLRKLQSQIDSLKLNDKIKIIPPQADLSPYFQAASIFAFPSIANSEAFGLVQAEALSYGLPVVNTNLKTGASGVSIGGFTGETVPIKNAALLGEALQKILSDEHLRASYSNAAKQRFEEKFTETAFKQRLISSLN